ncbi:hypothetical protein CC2G_001320 [Coprinopsis cinerea AmutBmut pab1-1]|nr:hypothetical protein CC2G_001320 [Coprinopsis cinerea AmutBmut pab1-1]
MFDFHPLPITIAAMGFGRERKASANASSSGVQWMEARMVTAGRWKTVKFLPTLPSPVKKKQIRANAKKMCPLTFPSPGDDRGEYIPFETDGYQLQTKRTKDLHNYMADWIPKQNLYLNEIVLLEAPPSPLKCLQCESSSSPTWWRCTDCIGWPFLCISCCCDRHLATPFHRIETLQGSFFTPSWLWHCGVSINLCPLKSCAPRGELDEADPETNGDGENDEEQDLAWLDCDDFSYGARPPSRNIKGMKVVVVVHSNGVHHLPIHFCCCFDALEPEYQLLRNGFYPATSKNVRTIFTFTMLDEYLLETLECFTSTHHYYSKLRRLTNEPFPDTVSVSILTNTAYTRRSDLTARRIVPGNFAELGDSGEN